jgi:acyl-CoA hydrolase
MTSDYEVEELEDLVKELLREEILQAIEKGEPFRMGVHNLEDPIIEHLREIEKIKEHPENYVNDVIREIEDNEDVTIEYSQYHDYQITPNILIPDEEEPY